MSVVNDSRGMGSLAACHHKTSTILDQQDTTYTPDLVCAFSQVWYLRTVGKSPYSELICFRVIFFVVETSRCTIQIQIRFVEGNGHRFHNTIDSRPTLNSQNTVRENAGCP